MSEGVFRIADKRPARDGMTISRNTGLGTKTGVSFFSLGKNTSMTAQQYTLKLRERAILSSENLPFGVK